MATTIQFLRRHALILAACIAATVPLWLVRHPPMQDFPVHFATLRVMHHFHDPAFGFDKDYVLTLDRTQYLGFYAVGHLLAYVVGVKGAVLALVAFFLAGTPLAARALVLALDRDERLALAAVPMLYGPLLGLGLLPFLVAIPVLLWGIAALVRRARAPSLREHVIVGVSGVALFYLHVVELGLFLVAAAALFPWRGTWRARIVAASSLVPCAGILTWWVFGTDGGRHMLEIGTHWGAANRPPLGGALADVEPWVFDMFPDASDEIVAIALFAVLGWASWCAFREGGEKRFPSRMYVVLPILSLVLFITGERSRGAIFPLGKRYMLPAALLALPLLVLPRDERTRRRTTIALASVSLAAVVNAGWHFVRFEGEVGDLDGALAHMEPNKRVAALLYDQVSQAARSRPFMHFGSYYQGEKGGVSYFTFAGHDYWPLDFKTDRYPIYDGPATPRWEYYTDRSAQQPLGAFDYLLVRDRGDHVIPTGFHLRWSGPRWEVYERGS